MKALQKELKELKIKVEIAQLKCRLKYYKEYEEYVSGKRDDPPIPPVLPPPPK